MSKIKKFINSIKIPRLLDFFIKTDAKDPYQPTTEEITNDAPKDNWDRLGLGWISNIGLPVWVLFAMFAAILALKIGTDDAIFFVIFTAPGLFLAVLFYSIWRIYKKFKKR